MDEIRESNRNSKVHMSQMAQLSQNLAINLDHIVLIEHLGPATVITIEGGRMFSAHDPDRKAWGCLLGRGSPAESSLDNLLDDHWDETRP